MKKIQLTLTAALLLCGAAAFAGDKGAKADNNADAKATANVEAAATPKQADAKADEDDPPYTYYVTDEGLDENGNPIYFVTTTPVDCHGTGLACKVDSNQQEDLSDNSIPQSAVTHVYTRHQ